MEVREYSNNDLDGIIRIWNEVVEDGIAFPQEDLLDNESGAEFFACSIGAKGIPGSSFICARITSFTPGRIISHVRRGPC